LQASQLVGVDLLVIALPTSAFSPAEITAMRSVLNQGGNLFLIGDNSGFSTNNNIINNALADLGSEIRITNTFDDSGSFVATTANGQMIAHPLTQGAAGLEYGGNAISGVSGGVTIFLESNKTTPFIAVQNVPEPSASIVIFLAVSCLRPLGRRISGTH
jgi:hypothetical protein